MSSDRPMQRNYARLELERRFRLTALPPGVATEDFARLHDLFATGTGLRIRRVTAADGRELVTKVGQKLPDPEAPEAPGRNLLTTIYLSPDQATPLLDLPGPKTCKRRYSLKHQGHTWAIDMWEAPSACAGLIMAEVECPTVAELTAITPPTWATEEVTDSRSYSAYALATAGKP